MAQYTQGLYQSIIKSRVFQFLSHRLDTRLVQIYFFESNAWMIRFLKKYTIFMAKVVKPPKLGGIAVNRVFIVGIIYNLG